MIFLEIGGIYYNCPKCNAELNGDKIKTYKYQRYCKEKVCPECGKIYCETFDMKGDLVAFEKEKTKDKRK